MSQSIRPRVSLCMIVRNEEQNLHDCLRGISFLFDEIIVVDTGSTDATKQIAEKFSARVIDFPWCDDFSAARNECLRHATGDWIMWIDADDRLQTSQRQRLSELLARLSDRNVGYEMETVCVPEFECDEAEILKHVRLFPRTASAHWQGRVHEQVRWSDPAEVCRIERCNVQIEHIGYRDPGIVRKKLNRNLRLLRMDYAINPNDVSTLFHLGQAYMQMGNHADAKFFYVRCLQVSNSTGEWKLRAYENLAEIVLREGRANESLVTLENGLQEFPNEPRLLLQRGVIFYEIDDFQRAALSLEMALVCLKGRRFPLYETERQLGKLVRRELAETYRMMGRLPEAETVLQELIAEFPDNAMAWMTLGNVYLAAKATGKFEYVLQQIPKCPQGNVYGLLLRVNSLVFAGDWIAAEPYINQLVEAAPRMVKPRLLRARMLLATGANDNDCLAAIRDVLRMSPTDSEAQQILQIIQLRQHGQTTISVSEG